MGRPLFALAALAIYFGITFAARLVRHRQQTGRSGYVGIAGRPGSIAWWAGTSFAGACVVAGAGPILELAGVIPGWRTPAWTFGAGCLAIALGTSGTAHAQARMGASWRIGVRDSERTDLVTSGVFGVVRNPIFSFLLLTIAGVALVAPGPLTALTFIAFLLAVELQVRFVEEPYLRGVHGARYERYCRMTGRFVPRARLARAPE